MTIAKFCIPWQYAQEFTFNGLCYNFPEPPTGKPEFHAGYFCSVQDIGGEGDEAVGTRTGTFGFITCKKNGDTVNVACGGNNGFTNRGSVIVAEDAQQVHVQIVRPPPS